MNQSTTATTQPAGGNSSPPMSDREFALLQKLIYRQSGIHLAPIKKALLEARLTRRVRELGLKSFDAYYRHIMGLNHGDELVVLLDRISTNETHFFREPKQFEFLAKEVFPGWKDRNKSASGGRHIRIWSAGCSSGEEPYSIAMVLRDNFPLGSGWEFEILATDLSSRVLGQGFDGVWPITKAREIPHEYLRKYLLKGIGEQKGKMKAGPELRSVIRFERVNLNDADYPVAGNLDLIFCRNVLIYFDAHSRARVIERLVDRLAPDGFLFVGHAESLAGVTDRVRFVVPTIYTTTHPAHTSRRPLLSKNPGALTER